MREVDRLPTTTRAKSWETRRLSALATPKERLHRGYTIVFCANLGEFAMLHSRTNRNSRFAIGLAPMFQRRIVELARDIEHHLQTPCLRFCRIETHAFHSLHTITLHDACATAMAHESGLSSGRRHICVIRRAVRAAYARRDRTDRFALHPRAHALAAGSRSGYDRFQGRPRSKFEHGNSCVRKLLPFTIS